MEITSANVAHYLARRGIIAFESAASGSFFVADLRRRNHHWFVRNAESAGWALKQCRRPDLRSITASRTEAAFYRQTSHDIRWSSLSGLTPKYIDYDEDCRVLIIELLADHQDLLTCVGNQKMSPELAAAWGRALAICHSFSVPADCHGFSMVSPFPFLSRQKPMVLSVVSSERRLPEPTNHIEVQLLSCIREHFELRDLLERIRTEWTWEALIHGDLRWDNVMASRRQGIWDLRLVDWEFVAFGDPAWDVGCVLSSFLSGPILANRPTASNGAPIQPNLIASLKSASCSFVTAYLKERGIDPQSAHSFLDKSLRCCAARMLQTMYEYAHVSVEFDTVMMGMLQSCMELYRNPHRMAEQKFGFVLGA